MYLFGSAYLPGYVTAVFFRQFIGFTDITRPIEPACPGGESDSNQLFDLPEAGVLLLLIQLARPGTLTLSGATSLAVQLVAFAHAPLPIDYQILPFIIPCTVSKSQAPKIPLFYLHNPA